MDPTFADLDLPELKKEVIALLAENARLRRRIAHLEEENNIQWHTLNPERMGR